MKDDIKLHSQDECKTPSEKLSKLSKAFHEATLYYLQTKMGQSAESSLDYVPWIKLLDLEEENLSQKFGSCSK